MNLTRTKDAASEVVSLNEVKAQLRITTTADDESLCLFIAAVRQRTETFLGKTLISSTPNSRPRRRGESDRSHGASNHGISNSATATAPAIQGPPMGSNFQGIRCVWDS